MVEITCEWRDFKNYHVVLFMAYLENISVLYGLREDEKTGYSEKELEGLEKRLGIQLPARLREYYLGLGKNERINSSHNRLLKPDGQVNFDSNGYLVFCEENQVVAYWGIKQEDLSLDNPAVWGNYGTEQEPDWHRETGTTEDFLLLMAVYNGTLGGLKHHANCFDEIPPAIVNYIAGRWNEIPAISWDRQKIYTNDYGEVVSLSFDGNGHCTALFIGTSIRDRFNDLLDNLNVEWSYVSDEDEEDESEE